MNAPLPAVLRTSFLLRHAFIHGHWWIAANILYKVVAIELRWTFMPKRAMRMALEHVENIRQAHLARRKNP